MIIKLTEAVNEEQLMKNAEGYKSLKSLCDKYGYKIETAANYILANGDTNAEITLQLKDKNRDRFAPEYFAYDTKSKQWECGISIDFDKLDSQDLAEFLEYAELTNEFMAELEKFDLTTLALINTSDI